jgi:hypothetical protein
MVLKFVEPAWRSGDGVIVIATRDHLETLQAMWRPDLNTVRRDGADDGIFLEARETLAAFMADGLPDPQRFDDVVGGLVR